MKNYLKQHYLLLLVLFSVPLLFVSCSSDDDATDPVQEVLPPIELACDYFSENPNAVLADEPNAPVDYIIDCTMIIPDDVSIEPGVTIAFGQRAGLKVSSSGSLHAVGTSANPIIFTATNNQNGWWGGIEYLSTNQNNKISHALIEYAGAILSDGNSVSGDAALSIDNDASLELTNTVIQKSSEAGLFIATRGITGSDEARIAAVSLQGNTYTENKVPVSIPFYMVGNLGAGDDYSGNQEDKVLIHSREFRGVTVSMNALNVPYKSTGRLHISDGGGNPSHLTIQAGVELEMAAGSNFIVFGGPNYLTAVGTENEKIIIRGASETPGSWQNIIFKRSGPADLNILEHVDISHARSDINNNGGALNLDFINDALKLTLNHVHFSEIAGSNCPIDYVGDLSTLTFSNLSDDQGLLPNCLD
ncbi:MAG: hypothetical protein WDZ45_02600 [Flavobacteriaceae bacterium]